jgi:hypothetical protein
MDRYTLFKNIIEDLQHKRFENKDRIINKLLVQNDVFNVSLEEGYRDIDTIDYILIGTIEFTDNDYIDFQLFYLLDNDNQLYITETEILEQ